ncbi:DUF3606 domain-containing protein [Pedobacter namyangjuensis]|uniref:DUF3606 domain-containing protein n=1 Tax=Pedobacter namyangjuensis TaxID=600626 RepID=UPI000DE2F2C5|nr:DUF3606 domain-containing protein [Pedobacter namyangjuensis]
MEENKDDFGFGENIPDTEQTEKQFSIEDDADTLEPFVDQDEHREINADDPADIARWAQEFQLSEQDLKDAIVLNGNSVKQIKKYLSV